jgi:DNA-binding GntR family transcriptional regulator
MSQRTTIRPAREEKYLYRRIEDTLRRLIRDETFRTGDRLPSEVELARQFGTTRVTVAKALAQLERDGLVRRLVGRGRFLLSQSVITSAIDTRLCYSFEEQMGLADRSVTYRLLGFERVPAPPFAQAQLDIGAEEQIYQLERLRLVDGRVIGVEMRYIPPVLAARITAPELAESSILEIVSDLLGYHVPKLAVTLYPDVADAALAERLDVEPGSPVSVREHVYQDRQGQVVLCGRNIFCSDVRLSYALGATPPAIVSSTEADWPASPKLLQKR